MFSALKFIAAGVIVALFGGFLLAGVLTTPQGDEVAPAAVTESPEPEATTAPEEPTEPPDPSVRTDILPGIALTVEEVEPGVLSGRERRRSDFAFPVDPEVPYDIVAGHDGGIYVLEPGHYARLGEGGGSAQGHKGFDWNLVDAFPSDVGVAPDGTIWAVFGGRLYSSPWGSGHETRHLPTMEGPEPIEVTSDGTVWAVWRDDSGSAVFGYLGADGWTMVGEWPFDGGYLRVSDRGEVWAVVPTSAGGSSRLIASSMGRGATKRAAASTRGLGVQDARRRRCGRHLLGHQGRLHSSASTAPSGRPSSRPTGHGPMSP